MATRGDKFVFHDHWGNDTIRDFQPVDVIAFEAGLFSGFYDLMAHAQQVGRDVLIERGIDSLLITDYQLINLMPDDFSFFV